MGCILRICCYRIIHLTVIEITKYPRMVSPIDTYLSMLGNAGLNPYGAIFYNLAVILTGLAELPFFIAIFSTYKQYSPRWLLIIGILFGLTNGLAVLMSGGYAQHLDYNAHIIWSFIIFFSLIPMLIVFGLAFWVIKGISRYFGLYSFIVCAIDSFFLTLLLSGQIGTGLDLVMEWIPVFSFLIWVLFISFDVLRKTSAS
jgi:hypothetical protein